MARSKSSIRSYTQLTNTIRTKRPQVGHNRATIVKLVAETALFLIVTNKIVAQFIINQ
jgi:hypothetical protein